MYRLINWKPRLYATHWTLCGTRRSPTVASRRRTCTVKRSGKCFLLFLFPSLTEALFSLVWPLLPKDFLSFFSIAAGCFVRSLKALIRFPGSLSIDLQRCFDPSRTSPSPLCSCPLRSAKISPHSFTAVPLSLSLFPCFSLPLCSSYSDRLRSD